MGLTLSEKIIKNHIVDGEMVKGTQAGIRIDQTLTQDATGTMAYLEFEAMGVKRVKTELSVAYIDHNTLQTGFENADDHRFIQSVCKKRGVRFSRPGNGIAIKYILKDLVFREKLLSAQTVTRQPAAVSECLPLAPVVLMLLLQWAVVLTT